MTLQLTYVGHASVLIDLDGTRLLTDPLLRKRVTHLRRRVPLVAGVERNLEAVLVSHGHYDHLDLGSLRRLGRTLRLVVPRGLGPLLRRKGFSAVSELGVGETVGVGSVEVTATPANHDGRRPLGPRAEAVGYLVRGTATVYFAGDTDLFPELERLGPVDVALVPVAGWGPRIGPGHLDPLRAAEAVRRLRPGLAVPIHWGTYSSPRREAWPGAPGAFAQAVGEAAPDIPVRILQPGESLSL